MMKAILLAMFVMHVLSGHFPQGQLNMHVLSGHFPQGQLNNNTNGSPTLVIATPASGYTVPVGPFGGNGGAPFTDEHYWKKNGKKTTAVRIRSGQIVNSIQFKYGKQWGPMHGGNGGALSTLDLTTQKISLVQGSYGQASTYYQPQPLVTSLLMDTDAGRAFGQFGNPIQPPNYIPITFISNPKPCHLAYVSGRSGTYLVSLTLHWQC